MRTLVDAEAKLENTISEAEGLRGGQGPDVSVGEGGGCSPGQGLKAEGGPEPRKLPVMAPS